MKTNKNAAIADALNCTKIKLQADADLSFYESSINRPFIGFLNNIIKH